MAESLLPYTVVLCFTNYQLQMAVNISHLKLEKQRVRTFRKDRTERITVSKSGNKEGNGLNILQNVITGPCLPLSFHCSVCVVDSNLYYIRISTSSWQERAAVAQYFGNCSTHTIPIIPHFLVNNSLQWMICSLVFCFGFFYTCCCTESAFPLPFNGILICAVR